MAAEKIVPLRDWVEPAHPMLVKLHDELVTLYTFIKDHYQERVDKAFDDVSREIGYVVTTTVPIVLEIKDRGSPFHMQMAAEYLKGTLFERALREALNPQPLPPQQKDVNISTGSYQIYLFWYSALKLRLRTEWIEPAHVAISAEQAFARLPMSYPKEPAHWFDAGSFLPQEEVVLIDAIDTVYPELKLADRISATRSLFRFRPGVREPAHFRPEIREPAHFRPEIREPAHFRPGEQAVMAERALEVLAQVAAMLRRTGF
jgi:hypothetical protein